VNGTVPDVIRTHPDPVLSRPAAPALSSDTPLEPLLARLWSACHTHGGAGLAAPQLGVSLRVAIVDGDTVGHAMPRIHLIDPEILETGPAVRGEEGCLSFPGIFATVRRPGTATVLVRTPAGKEHVLRLEGLAARAVLHEIDHLDGILMPDRMGPLRRWLFLRRYALRTRRKRKAGLPS